MEINAGIASYGQTLAWKRNMKMNIEMKKNMSIYCHVCAYIYAQNGLGKPASRGSFLYMKEGNICLIHYDFSCSRERVFLMLIVSLSGKRKVPQKYCRCLIQLYRELPSNDRELATDLRRKERCQVLEGLPKLYR